MQWWEKMLAVMNQSMLATTNIPPDTNQSQEEFQKFYLEGKRFPRNLQIPYVSLVWLVSSAYH